MDCGVEDQEIAEMRALEYQDRGVLVFSNVWKNSNTFPSSHSGLSLRGKFQDRVAIVCGAGVSLERIFPILQDLHDRALLIAGGSAIAALHREGISPHFMMGVDPDPSKERFLDQQGFVTPFVYQARFSQQQLSLCLGPKVWMPGSGSNALDAEILSCNEVFDAGWSVANFSVAFATFLGCSKVVLAGMDFCAPKTQMYASSLSFSPQEELMIPLAGTSLYTRRDWRLSRNWLLQWIENHPHIQWQRGESLDPVITDRIEQFSLSELLQIPPCDLQAEIHALLQQTPYLSVTKEQVERSKKGMKDSVQRAYALCNQMLIIWEKGHPKLPFDRAEYVICKTDLHQEISYQEILFPLWQVWKIPLLKEELYEAGKQLHELLFFKTTLEMYLAEMS